MDEESQEEKLYSSSRHRSPTFSREEVTELINIIYKYKHIIMNKSICASACHAKEVAWTKMAKLFNDRGFEYVRSTESLKRKWDNVKKDYRKTSRNLNSGLLDATQSEINELDAKILSILCETENSSNIDSQLELDDDTDVNEHGELMVEEKDVTNHSEKFSDPIKYPQYENGEKQSDNDSTDAGDNIELRRDKSARMNRSLNFSPKECSVLLHCVKQEKRHVFDRDVTARAIKLKNRAWTRITDTYNKLSPRKRSVKVLRTKFCNMKRMARRIGVKKYLKEFDNKHEKLLDDSFKSIKDEPEFGEKLDGNSDWPENNDDDDDDIFENEQKTEKILSFTPDPLSSVLNGDSGIGSMSHTGPLNQSEDKEVVKLKRKLLNYQMETAKLERKRIEDVLRDEASARESRALETALRLRAARLEALAAEARLPPSHPGLHYTPDEARAQHYLSQYHQT